MSLIPVADAIPDQLRAFLDNSPAVAWMKDAEGRHVYLSKPYIEMIGVPCTDWFGKTDFDLWPHPVAARFQQLDDEVLRSGEAIQFEDEENVTFCNGVTRTWWVTKFPIKDLDGMVYIGGIAVDITHQKRTQEALRYQHMVSERLIDSARNIVLVLDNDGRIVRFNTFMEQLGGWNLDDVKGRHWAEVYLRPDDYEHERRRLEAAIHRVHGRGHILPITTRSGDTLIVEWYNSPLTDENGAREGLLCVGADTTERRLMEHQIDRIAEIEQRRIGQELHDGIGQELTALRMFSEHLVEQLEHLDSSDPATLEPIHSLARKIAEGLQVTNGNVQSLSRSMASTNIGSETLHTLLSNLASTTNSLPQIVCEFQCVDSPRVTDNVAAQHLYRIAQEAVNNAIKHSSASRIDLTLRGDKKRTALEIRDDGIGTPISQGESIDSREMGVGLHVMRYRADLIDSDLRIEANEHGGTSVICMLRSCSQ